MRWVVVTPRPSAAWCGLLLWVVGTLFLHGEFTHRVDARALNVRAEASGGAAKVNTLGEGTPVRVAERTPDGKWARVETASGNGGWVATAYLREYPKGEETKADAEGAEVLEAFTPSAKTIEDTRVVVVSAPGPRGRILDRNGEVLALNKVANQVVLQGYGTAHDDVEDFVRTVTADVEAVAPILGKWVRIPDDEAVRGHWEHRRQLPLTISRPGVPEGIIAKLKAEAGIGSRVGVREIYLRAYPKGRGAAHVLGHLVGEGPGLEGPVRQEEPLWPLMRGAAGIENVYDEDLKGTAGIVALGYNLAGEETGREIVRSPLPGNDVVLTLDYGMQREVEKALRSTGRAGAAVLLDAASGDILAMASLPGFDPGFFASTPDAEAFAALQQDAGSPLLPRAWAAAYPPGSIFKPVVALAALESRALSVSSRLYCPPAVDVGGRTFRNWSQTDDGVLDLRGALARSHNTFFYQAGQRAGAASILNVARQFGLDEAPSLPFDGVTSGALPQRVPGPQALANLSIGQGEVLASPLQVTLMMAGLAHGGTRPQARLVSQIQNGNGEVLRSMPRARETRLALSEHYLSYVRSGLYAVVNHVQGTGQAAYQPSVPLFGKTGTAEWRNKGVNASAAWFAGFVPGVSPPLAFAVVIEGRGGEDLYGGSTAAPVAARFLETFFEQPEAYGLAMPRRLLFIQKQDDPLIMPMREEKRERGYRPSEELAAPTPPREWPPRRRFPTWFRR